MNKKIFRPHRKIVKEGAVLISKRRVLHNHGATTEKALEFAPSTVSPPLCTAPLCPHAHARLHFGREGGRAETVHLSARQGKARRLVAKLLPPRERHIQHFCPADVMVGQLLKPTFVHLFTSTDLPSLQARIRKGRGDKWKKRGRWSVWEAEPGTPPRKGAAFGILPPVAGGFGLAL